jgi:NDP-sugar pyrophosphorylase family protein
MLKILFLCAGYGTRLQRDIDTTTGDTYRHLSGRAKALVPIGNKDALLTHWIDQFRQLGLTDFHLITNDFYLKQFTAWAHRHDFDTARIVSDQTVDNTGRIGAVGCIKLAVEHFGLQNAHVLVVAGDTLFLPHHVDLRQVISRFDTLCATRESPSSMVLCYPCADQDVCKTGILDIERSGAPSDHGRVVGMLEKPTLKVAGSLRNACPCFYFLHASQWALLDRFVLETQHLPLDERDATGKYLSWLISRHAVYAVDIGGRCDVGDLASYIETHKAFLLVDE